MGIGRSCDVCGKGGQRANLVSHAKNRTKILRKPNLHVHTMKVDDKKIKLKVCSKCKRAVRVPFEKSPKK